MVTRATNRVLQYTSLLLIWGSVAIVASPLSAQQPDATQPPAEPEETTPADPPDESQSLSPDDIATPASGRQASLIQRADTSSPRATLVSFIDACNSLYELILASRYIDPDVAENRAIAMRIVDCLDTSQLPEYAIRELSGETAVYIKEIIDRIELPPIDEIPDLDAIEAAGGSDNLTRWQIPGSRLTIARIEEGPQKHEYLFSAGTLDRAQSYYEDVKLFPYRTTGLATSPGLYRWYFSSPRRPAIGAIVDALPDWTRDRLLGMTIWKWPFLIVMTLIAVSLMVLIYAMQSWYGHIWRKKGPFLYLCSIIVPLTAVPIPWMYVHYVEFYLGLRGTPLYVVTFLANVIGLLAAAFVVVGLSSRLAELMIASPRIQPTGLDAQLIRIVTKLLGLGGIIIILLEGGQYLGIPITTLLAGAGVGGLAVALAAQDTVKALFGTITLMADKPFRVGERIVFQNYDGVVEEIGLRSTRIRLLTGHQATVPNDELARIDIENVGRRPHIRRVSDIRIPLDTPRDKLEVAVDVVRAALENHEGMVPEYPPRVFFNEFNDDSFNIRMFYWYHPANYWDFLDFSQRLNVEICQEFEKRDIPFSLPTRMTYTNTESRQDPLELRIVERSESTPSS